MIRGTRVRIEKAPEGHEDLKGKEGKVKWLSSKVPLEYLIKVEDERVRYMPLIRLPSTSLMVLDYEEVVETGHREDCPCPVLKVNGLCYCKNHRRETCDQCGYDFLMQNLAAELTHETKEVSMKEPNVERLVAQLKAAGAPVRMAPPKKLKSKKVKYCSFCGNSNSKLSKCSGCKTVHYCGRRCQKNDWKMHKLVCSASSM